MVLLALHIIALRRCIMALAVGSSVPHQTDGSWEVGHVCDWASHPKGTWSKVLFGVWNPKPFHQRFSGIYLALRAHGGLKSIFLYGKQLEEYFSLWEQVAKLARWKCLLMQRQKIACWSSIFALIVIMLFVQTMHSLCLWPLVSTTEFLQPFLHRFILFPFFYLQICDLNHFC